MNANLPAFDISLLLPSGCKLPAIPSLPLGNRDAPGRCGVCGRRLPDQRGQAGRTRLYCRGSACTDIAKRLNEMNGLLLSLVGELVETSTDPEDARAYASSIKSYLWSELNGSINAMGPLKAKKAR